MQEGKQQGMDKGNCAQTISNQLTIYQNYLSGLTDEQLKSVESNNNKIESTEQRDLFIELLKKQKQKRQKQIFKQKGSTWYLQLMQKISITDAQLSALSQKLQKERKMQYQKALRMRKQRQLKEKQRFKFSDIYNGMRKLVFGAQQLSRTDSISISQQPQQQQKFICRKSKKQ